MNIFKKYIIKLMPRGVQNLRMSVLLLLCLLATAMLYSQPLEKLYLHTDKDFYVTGEDVWLSGHFVGENKVESEILHVEIIAPNNKVVAAYRFEIENNTTQGDFRIPLNWQTGKYKMRAYTLYMLNFGNDFIFQKELPIFNDLQPLEDGIFKFGTGQKVAANASTYLKLDKNTYQPREKVQLEIKVPQGGNNFVVRVFDKALIPNIEIPQPEKYPKTGEASKGKYKPEKGLSFKGVIKEVNTNQPAKSNATSIFVTEDQVNVWEKSDAEGNISFTLPLFEGVRHLQIHDALDRNFFSFKNEKTVEHDFSDVTTQPAPLPSKKAVEEYLALSRKRKKFQQVFGIENLPPFVDFPTIKTSNIPADRNYKVDDFVAFKSTEEFIDEVIKTINFKRTKKELRFKVLDEKKLMFPKSPAIFLNNVITYDPEEILQLPIKELAEFKVYKDNQTIIKEFKALGLNGVISVQTQSNDITLASTSKHLIEVEGLSPSREFIKLVNTEEQNIPDFRPILHWQTNLTPDENGKIVVEFYTSDDASTYQVEVVGLVNGNLVKYLTDFTVNNNIR